MKEFIAVNVSCEADFVQILIAELSELPFDTFEEREGGFTAYAKANSINDHDFDAIVDFYQEAAKIKLDKSWVEKENWNREWETNYEPIVVEGKCLVRAGFHAEQSKYPFEIIINPKMSFGTGHHETTYLMLAGQLKLEHKNKRVLDAGCGTGILSIMAGKMGCVDVTAFDNDKWVIDNVKENLKINNQQADVRLGTLSELNFSGLFDIILANINKNVLLEDMDNFARSMTSEGHLLLSGFYQNDLHDIKKAAENSGLTFIDAAEKHDWTRAHFKKIHV